MGRGPAGPRAPVGGGGERAVRGGGLNKREEKLPPILPPCRSSPSAGEQPVYFLPFPVGKGECSAAVAGKGVSWVRRQLPFSVGVQQVCVAFSGGKIKIQLEEVGDSSSPGVRKALRL